MVCDLFAGETCRLYRLPRCHGYLSRGARGYTYLYIGAHYYILYLNFYTIKSSKRLEFAIIEVEGLLTDLSTLRAMHGTAVHPGVIEHLHVTSQVRRSTKTCGKTYGVCTGKGAF